MTTSLAAISVYDAFGYHTADSYLAKVQDAITDAMETSKSMVEELGGQFSELELQQLKNMAQGVIHGGMQIAREEISSMATKVNAQTVLGYIPLIGAYTGYNRIIDNMDPLTPLSARVVSIIRGVLEILCLGFLFIIPDIIVSIHRHFCVAAPESHLGNNEYSKMFQDARAFRGPENNNRSFGMRPQYV